MTTLIDPHNRQLTYLRLSVTDLCNYRCSYCLPNGYQGKAKPDELTLPEIQTIAAAFAQNGHQLGKKFPVYRQAGLTKLNISLDSFNPQTFHKITGKDQSQTILRDIETILNTGFTSIKINTLLLREHAQETLHDALNYIRSRPIALRFIELMQTGDNSAYFQQHHQNALQLEQNLIQQGWQLQPRQPHAGPAREYSHPDYIGNIGIIAPYSQDFCTTCNRLRITAQGKMHLCLFGSVAHDLRPYLHDVGSLKNQIAQLVQQKPEHHYLHNKKVGLITNLSITGG